MKKWTTILISGVAGIILTGCTESKKATAVSDPVDPDVIAYPLDTCIVADKKLGSMGKPYVFVHEKRQIKFCCIGCDEAQLEKQVMNFLIRIQKNISRNSI